MASIRQHAGSVDDTIAAAFASPCVAGNLILVLHFRRRSTVGPEMDGAAGYTEVVKRNATSFDDGAVGFHYKVAVGGETTILTDLTGAQAQWVEAWELQDATPEDISFLAVGNQVSGALDLGTFAEAEGLAFFGAIAVPAFAGLVTMSAAAGADWTEITNQPIAIVSGQPASPHILAATAVGTVDDIDAEATLAGISGQTLGQCAGVAVLVGGAAPDPEPVAEAWDIYAADALLGEPIATFEHAKGRYIRSELHNLGEGGFEINRHAPEATEENLAEGNMIKAKIPDCGPAYFDGFFLGPDGDYTLLSPQGGKGKENLTFRGPGPLSYLDRARMSRCAFSIPPSTVGSWTEVWKTNNVARPVGTAVDLGDLDHAYAVGLSSRKIKKIDQSTREVVGSTPALWSGTSRYAGGLSFDPDDDGIAWLLEAPWLAGSSAHTKIHKVDRTGPMSGWNVTDTFDLGSAVRLTGIRVDGDFIYTSNYDNNKIQQRSKTTGDVVDSDTITWKGKLQTKPNGIAINGTQIAYWFGGDSGGGTGRALVADTSDPWTITGVLTTKGVSAFGGEWYTDGGEQFLIADSYVLGRVWKYQLTTAVPACADDSGVFHPEQTSPGALAWRILVEITHEDRPAQPCAELSFDFTQDEDSNGTAWPARTSTEEFTWRVGDRAFSDVLARLIPAGVTFDLDVNTMTLHAYVDSTFGTDRTSGDFAVGKVRFVEGVNLGVNGDLGRRDNRGQPETDLMLVGDGGAVGSATLAGRYVREGFLQVSGPTTAAVLDAIGDDELARQRLVADALGFETIWGNAEEDEATQLAGRYIPKKHCWKGDRVTVDMEAAEFSYEDVELRVYGTLISERDGKQITPGGPVEPGWRWALDLGAAYKIPPPMTSVGGQSGSSSSTGSGGGGSSGGTTVVTAIPLTVSDGGDVNIPRVTKLIAEGVTSPEPGVAIIPTNPRAGDGFVEELLTDETDTSSRLAPDGAGGVEFRQVDVDELVTAETDTTLVAAPDGAGGIEFRAETGGGSGLPWFVVTDPAYGAANDATTVDTSAINAAIAAYNAAGGGVLYFPGGAGYKVNGTLTALTAPGLVLGDGGSPSNPATKIIQTATTVHTLTQAAHGVTFRGIRGERSGGASTAGSFIHVTVGDRGFYEDCSASGFWRNIDFEDGAEWFMHGCHWTDAVKHNARIAHPDLVDGGDWTMLGCHFGSVVGTEASIRYESGGGGKIIGCKFNGGGTKPILGIDIAYATGIQSSVILIQGNSLENMSSDAIRISTAGTGRLGHIAIVGNQFGLYGNNTGRIVNIAAAAAGNWNAPHDGTISNVLIDGNVAYTDGTARAAIGISNADLITIGELQLIGFNARYTISGGGTVTDSGSGAPSGTAGGDLSGTYPNPSVVDDSHAHTATTIDMTGEPAGGDLSGTYPNPSVVDDSHAHTAATLPAGSTAGLVPVQLGSPAVAAGPPFVVTMTSVWGVNAGVPYYDSANVTSGQEAALFYDPATDEYVLVEYSF